MAWFNAFKSYEHEINEIRRYLDLEKNMRAEYSGPFIAAYGKKMGVLIENGRKKALSFNTSSASGAESNQIFAENGIRFAVLGQAIRAYLTDLRAGKYVSTAVETAIWGIILDEEPDLVDSMKPGLSDFVLNNFERMAPSARSVFVHDQPEPRNKAAGKRESNLSGKSGLKINPSGSDQKRVFEALISMLGEENTYKALELLSCNDLVVKSLGNSVSHMKLNSRLSITLGWLTNVVDNESIWVGMLSAGNDSNVDYDSRTSSVGKSSFSVNDASSLVKDVKNHLDIGRDFQSIKKGQYSNFLESGPEDDFGNDSQPQDEMSSSFESSMNYMREIDVNLNAILCRALKTQDSTYAELVSAGLWSSNARACGVKAGTKLGLPPGDAAMLTALIVGQTYERVHQGIPATNEMKTTYEQHMRVAIFLNRDLERLQSTSHPVEFLKIFMDEFDITTLYSGA